jgi:hypothetical protein
VIVTTGSNHPALAAKAVTATILTGIIPRIPSQSTWLRLQTTNITVGFCAIPDKDCAILFQTETLLRGWWEQHMNGAPVWFGSMKISGWPNSKMQAP